jgi:hypothetical protein
MSRIIGLESKLMRQAAAFGLDLALKSTAWLLLTIAIHALLGRRRVLARSALWNACLAGLLVLPPIVAWSPRLRVGGLERRDGDAIAQPVPNAPADAIDPQGARSESGREVVLAHQGADPGHGAGIPRTGGPRAAAVASQQKASGPSLPAPGSNRLLGLGGAALALVVYLLGGAVLALRLLGSLAAVARLRRWSSPVEIPIWRERLERWRAWLGITRPVAHLARRSLPGRLPVHGSRRTLPLG